MLLIEKDAKNKECPYKPLTYTTPGNAGEPVPQWTGFDSCSASECMMWRWENDLYSLDKERFIKPGERIDQGNVQLRNTEYGYCGLAGRVME